jgi:uncharacterized alkaline shock family protein YloU
MANEKTDSTTSPATNANASRRTSKELATSRGKTTIADTVVRKIAGVAAREVEGVHNLGTGGARAVGSLRQRIPGSSGPSVSQGVSVEVGERQAAIDLDIVVEYGVSVIDLAQSIRRNAVAAVEGMTGLEVTEVNIAVDDVYIPGDDDEDREKQARVE